ncbi:hypothetical protein Q31b_16360 [Novipirellula aureliae]|uniref:Transposase IS204/IS1001/IS1096/IS1165 DDE domain-containing protein n=1 Tax=Novipirellula aureliae TaxID=2527966 RepID=A0A5C6E8S3_9BACT|nr:transposase [Novipirellula aureliae]TWU44101.1 hypothetical protein Q31b_16360 [Novipirellula aureliae]
MRSKIEPMKDLAKRLRKKPDLLLNWFRADRALSSGGVEGFNNKRKRITRKSYGFRTQNAYEIALYHNLGDLPEPKFTHRFFLLTRPHSGLRQWLAFSELSGSSNRCRFGSEKDRKTVGDRNVMKQRPYSKTTTVLYV